MMIKDPGPGGMRLREVPLNLSFAADLRRAHARTPTSACCMDVIRGNQTLFMRRDELEAAWTWVDPILDGLGRQPAGSRRPTPPAPGARPASIALIERDGRTWHEADGRVTARPAQLRRPRRSWPRRWPTPSPSALGAASRRAAAASLAVSGGSTPALFFAALSASAGRRLEQGRRSRWSTSAGADETSPRSNAALVNEKLLQGPAAAARFRAALPGGDSADDAAESPHEALQARCRWPLDAVILGMGSDGHTASFFPGGDKLDDAARSRQARLVAIRTRRGAGEPRLTLTLPRLLEARLSGLHIEGEEKRAVLDQALRTGRRGHADPRRAAPGRDSRCRSSGPLTDRRSASLPLPGR